MTTNEAPLRHAVIDADLYDQSSVSKRIEACLLDHLGEIVTTAQIKSLAPGVENWHQRLSELRTDKGYVIETRRDRPAGLALGEYLLVSAERRPQAAKRVSPDRDTWAAVAQRAGQRCEWSEDGQRCGLREGDRDPIGAGTVRLSPDHEAPHSVDPAADPTDATRWRALCGRHQVTKKNFWDSSTGKVNLPAILQAASLREKRAALDWLTQALAGPPEVAPAASA